MMTSVESGRMPAEPKAQGPKRYCLDALNDELVVDDTNE